MTNQLNHISSWRPIAIRLLVVVSVTCGERLAAQTSLQQLRDVEESVLDHVDDMRAATVGVKLGTADASGVVIPGGFVLTSAHATKRIGQQARVFPLGKPERTAIVHAIDRTTDVALLRLDDASGLKAAVFRAANMTGVNRVVAVGNPGGFDPRRPSLLRFGALNGTNVLQSTCRLARGDSGGPLFDLSGQVVGIHRQIRVDATENYHSSGQAIMRNWDHLFAGGLIEGEAPAAKRFEIVLPKFQHAASRAVVEVQCGAKRVAMGTVIDRSRGLIVTKASELRGPVTVAVRNQRVTATIVRTDLATDLALLLVEADLPAALALPEKADTAKVGQFVLTVRPDFCRAGIVGALSRKVARQKGELGLVVSDKLQIEQVQPNSAARAAGLQRDDVIEVVDQRPIVSPADLAVALKAFNAGDVVLMKVRRNGLSMPVSLRLRHPAGSRFEDKTFQLGAGGVSSLRRSGFPSVLQHDCLVTADECGSPVIDLDGNLVGINIAKVGREAVYCVPAIVVQDFVATSKASANQPLRRK